MENIYSENNIATNEEDTVNVDQNLSEECQMLVKLDFLLHCCYAKIKKVNNRYSKIELRIHNQLVN